MSNSMYVSVSTMPETIETISEVIKLSLLELGFRVRQIYFGENELTENNLLNSFIHVDGENDGERCWVGFDDVGFEVTEDADCSIMASVSTRTDWIFAGAVAYAICRAYGRVIFNDSCQLDGQERYSAESMRTTLELLKAHS